MSTFPSFYTGFADEAGPDISTQIRATRELGWSAIELRNVRVPGQDTANVHDVSEAAFELVAEALTEAGVRVNSLGSGLANGQKDICQPFDEEEASARRAAVRGQWLGVEFVRVMSYPIGDVNDLREAERFRRLREIVSIFAGSGITVVHENCGNFGGMGAAYSLRLLEAVPGLRLVFDMGNTVSDLDYTQPAPHPRQNAWDFYRAVRAEIAYVHIKEAFWDEASQRKVHVFPGEGTGDVRRILADLRATGYANALSIEPHLHVDHVALVNRPDLTTEEKHYATYVEYGRRLMKLVAEIPEP